MVDFARSNWAESAQLADHARTVVSSRMIAPLSSSPADFVSYRSVEDFLPHAVHSANVCSAVPVLN